MYAKKLFLIVAIILLCTAAYSQALKNTSYVNRSGEKVLRLEINLPVDATTAWKLFTSDGKLKKWIAPVAHIELRAGGYIVTNYDSTKDLSDNSSIKLPITALSIMNYLF